VGGNLRQDAGPQDVRLHRLDRVHLRTGTCL
jgi:hypothetical protein